MSNWRAERIRKLRKQKGMTQRELAVAVEVSRSSVVAWEKGTYFPEGENLFSLSSVLGVTLDSWHKESPVFPPGARVITPEDTISIPVLSPASMACAGGGNGGMAEVVLEAEEFIILPRDWIGPISEDKSRQPIAIKVEGDSMIEANIPPGSEVVVNPVAEIYDGDTVLACYGQDNKWVIKWKFTLTNGNIELRASSARFPPLVFTPENIEDHNLRIIGKVVRVMNRPKRGE